MILEGIVTTIGVDGEPNISPMGPEVVPAMTTFVLKPYRTSRTYANLKRTGEGVLHVTDDVELLAQAAISRLEPPPQLRRATAVEGFILADACRWYAFRVTAWDERDERTRLTCHVVDRGRQRDFFGFNRAKHAVVEAAILATRVQFLSAESIQADLERLAQLVEKTGDAPERRAFALLDRHIQNAFARAAESQA